MFNISMKQIIIAIGNRDRDHPLVLLRSDDRATNCGTTGYRDNPGTDPGIGLYRIYNDLRKPERGGNRHSGRHQFA